MKPPERQRFGRSLRWQIVAGIAPLIVAAAVAPALVGHFAAERVLREEALERLRGLAAQSAALLESRVARIADQARLAASDARVVRAAVSSTGGDQRARPRPTGQGEIAQAGSGPCASTRDYYARSSPRAACARCSFPRKAPRSVSVSYRGLDAESDPRADANGRLPRYADEPPMVARITGSPRASVEDGLLVAGATARVYSAAKTPSSRPPWSMGLSALELGRALRRARDGARAKCCSPISSRAAAPRRGGGLAATPTSRPRLVGRDDRRDGRATRSERRRAPARPSSRSHRDGVREEPADPATTRKRKRHVCIDLRRRW